MRRKEMLFAAIVVTIVCVGCEDEPPATVWNDTPSRVPAIRLVHDGEISGSYAFHLQVDAVLEHDIIVFMQIANDRTGTEYDRFLMLRAGDFKSELMTIKDPHITPDRIKQRNEAYGENNWWGINGTPIAQIYPPPAPDLRGEKGLSWYDTNPSNLVRILPAEKRTNDILPKEVSNVKDLVILVEHPFRPYKLGTPSILYAAPRDYKRTSPPVTPRIPRASIISVNPRNLSRIEINTPIQLTFSSEVDSVAGANGLGRLWTIMATREEFQITWKNRDGSAGGPHTLRYTLEAPQPPPPPPDTTPPRITGGNIRHGAQNVDPGPLNADKIVITFDEEVRGVIELRLEDNTLLGWQGFVAGKEAVLRPVRNQELKHATTYIVIVIVADDAGNKAEYMIEFTTRLKPRRRL